MTEAAFHKLVGDLFTKVHPATIAAKNVVADIDDVLDKTKRTIPGTKMSGVNSAAKAARARRRERQSSLGSRNAQLDGDGISTNEAGGKVVIRVTG